MKLAHSDTIGLLDSQGRTARQNSDTHNTLFARGQGHDRRRDNECFIRDQMISTVRFCPAIPGELIYGFFAPPVHKRQNSDTPGLIQDQRGRINGQPLRAGAQILQQEKYQESSQPFHHGASPQKLIVAVTVSE